MPKQMTPIQRNLYTRNALLVPFLKWAGGKRQLLPSIRAYTPKHFRTYFEPFVGAGAVFFDLQPQSAHINDANAELVNCYLVIKHHAEDLIEDIKRHRNTSEYFYKLRELDRKPEYRDLSDFEKASRIIFLNKTCYNGLFRVNSQGQFNAPYGNYKNLTTLVDIVIRAISRYLNQSDIEITNLDFEAAVQGAKKGDFIYFDPPYDPVSDTASFTGYNLDQFDKEDQERLKVVYDRLTQKGCRVMLSNSSTDFILKLYRKYRIIRIPASRNINSVASGRGKVDELLILNYETDSSP